MESMETSETYLTEEQSSDASRGDTLVATAINKPLITLTTISAAYSEYQQV
jgi:hypothetical protein